MARSHRRHVLLHLLLNLSHLYSETMEVMLVLVTLLSIPPLIAATLMLNYYLNVQQNAVDQAGLTGERVIEGELERKERLQ